MLKRIISNLNVFLSRCLTSVANFGGSEVGCSENGGKEEKLKGINTKQIFLTITHVIIPKTRTEVWGLLMAAGWRRRKVNNPREELNSFCSIDLAHNFGSMRGGETSSIIERFNAKIAIVHFSIDINTESKAKKESMERMKMRKTIPPVRWIHERNKKVIRLVTMVVTSFPQGQILEDFSQAFFTPKNPKVEILCVKNVQPQLPHLSPPFLPKRTECRSIYKLSAPSENHCFSIGE